LTDSCWSRGIAENCSFNGTKLDQVRFEDWIFINCRGIGATFTETKWDNVVNIHSDWTGTLFTGTSMVQTVFRWCGLEGAHFFRTRKIKESWLEHCDLK